MGAARAELVVALQGALMRAASGFGAEPAVAPHAGRVLAAAAALDYVLMLARGDAGVRIPAEDAERAMRDGITRAVDELIRIAGAIATLGSADARAFAHEVARTIGDALAAEGLGGDDRRFAVIALANA